MKKIIVSLFLLTVASTASAQWRMIADFKGFYINDSIPETITTIYFLDLPGPPRIGYVGTESELWKTTDGGKSWFRSWAHEVRGSAFVGDICFKDSVTGWFSYTGYRGIGDAVYTTEDGGTTWRDLPGSFTMKGAGGLWYCNATNGLLFGHGDSLQVSTNLGSTWRSTIPFVATGFSFSSDSEGIATAGIPPDDTIFGILRTTDGGLNWNFAPEPFLCLQPLAIWGTPICFAASSGQITIFRSNDYGKTWDTVYNFPVVDSNLNEPYGSGVIRGDLSHLFIQSDSGMFLSTDQGKSWKREGGPSRCSDYPLSLFYASKGIAMAGMTYSDGAIEDGGLWEEDWGQAGVAEEKRPNSVFFLTKNPTDGQTELQFTLDAEAYVHVQVCDVLGRAIGGEETGKILSPGEHSQPLNLSSDPVGTYYVRISLGTGEARTIKIVKE